MGKKYLKKIVIVLIFVFTILNLCISYSNAGTEKTINLKSEIVKDEIKVFLNVDGIEKGALGLQGTLNFDHETLKLEEVKVNDENFKVTAVNNDNGKFIVEINDDAFFDTDKYLYSKENFIEFKFKDLKEKHNYKLTLAEVKFVDSAMETTQLEDITIKLKSKNWIIILVSIILFIIISFLIIKKKRRKK